jgi:hypothetical protein
MKNPSLIVTRCIGFSSLSLSEPIIKLPAGIHTNFTPARFTICCGRPAGRAAPVVFAAALPAGGLTGADVFAALFDAAAFAAASNRRMLLRANAANRPVG